MRFGQASGVIVGIVSSSIEGNKIMVRLTGACILCKLAGTTLEAIQARLIERLGEFVRLIPLPGAAKEGP